MANEERIAHYETLGFTRNQYLERRETHQILEEEGLNYLARKSQEQARRDVALLNSGDIDQYICASRKEQRKKSLDILARREYSIPYYLLICAKDKELVDAFKDATPLLLQTFAPLASVTYKAQYQFGLMEGIRSPVSKENLEYILAQNTPEAIFSTPHSVSNDILTIIQYCTPTEKNVILDSALFALLDHKCDMLTLEQIEAIERRKTAHEERIKDADTPPKKTHFETLDIHFPCTFVEDYLHSREHATISRILAKHITELETQINEMVAETEEAETNYTPIKIPTENARMQVDELERLRDMVKNLPTEREEEKKDILHRIDALCVLEDPNRELIYHYLITQNPELREIFIDASPKLIDKAIDCLCMFTMLHDEIQRCGLYSMGDINQRIAEEYTYNMKYGRNDANIREGKADFVFQNVIDNRNEDAALMRNMVLHSTLVELYKDKDSGLTEKKKEIIAKEVAFHNQKPQNESQPKGQNHYDRLGLTKKGHEIGNLVNPNYELQDHDIPPPLDKETIFKNVLAEKKANTDRAQPDVRHNFKIYQEIQREYNILRGAQVLCADRKMRLLYNAALDHPDINIREIAQDLSREEAQILKEKFFYEPLSDSPLFIEEWATEEERQIAESRYDLLHKSERLEHEVFQLFESLELIELHFKRTIKELSFFACTIFILSNFIRDIKQIISRLFSPKALPIGGYVRLDRKEYEKEIPEPPQQIPTLGAENGLDPEKEGELDPENPHDPQPIIDPDSEPDSPPKEMGSTDSAKVIPKDILQSH